MASQKEARIHLDSPYGICLCSNDESGIPFQGWPYRPDYLPSTVGIWMADNEHLPWEPAIFHLTGVRPWSESPPPHEPIVHSNGANGILMIEIGLNHSGPLMSDALHKLKKLDFFRISDSSRPLMKVVCRTATGETPRTLDLTPWCPLLIELAGKVHSLVE